MYETLAVLVVAAAINLVIQFYRWLIYKDSAKIPVLGGAFNFVDELIAYNVGHMRVGRINALPVSPLGTRYIVYRAIYEL